MKWVRVHKKTLEIPRDHILAELIDLNFTDEDTLDKMSDYEIEMLIKHHTENGDLADVYEWYEENYNSEASYEFIEG